MYLKKLLSIVTVVFNEREAVSSTIKSIIKNKSDEIEYLVIDGGSTDGTLEIINQYRDSIDLIISERDQGIYDAMNKGIKHSQGYYILNINCGDVLLINPLTYLRRSHFVGNAYDLILFNVKQSNGRLFINQLSKKMKFRNTLHHQGVLYRTDKKKLYDLNYKVFSDFDYNQRLFKSGSSSLKIEAVICTHDLGGVSHSKVSFSENYKIIVSNFGYCYLVIALIYYKIQGLKARLIYN
jgi:glycosyltransferase involved in cell wall biosynthesis